MAEEFDYVIVGSGAGGCTLAYRLAQLGCGTVLVVEHGRRDGNPLHRVPKGAFLTQNQDRYTHRYRTAAIPGTDPRRSGSAARSWAARPPSTP